MKTKKGVIPSPTFFQKNHNPLFFNSLHAKNFLHLPHFPPPSHPFTPRILKTPTHKASPIFFFGKKVPDFLFSGKNLIFAAQLPYCVMVAPQILVLFVWVRILVGQQDEGAPRCYGGGGFLFRHPYHSLFQSLFSVFKKSKYRYLS